MVIRTMEMREIGFKIPKIKRIEIYTKYGKENNQTKSLLNI